MQCKSLWIKASTKCINVNVNVIRSDSRSMVSYINHQGGPHLEAPLHAGERPSCLGSDQSALTEGDACAGQMNQGADMLLRDNVSSEEWTLHPLTVQKIWEVFGRARVDLFASEDNSHCQSIS